MNLTFQYQHPLKNTFLLFSLISILSAIFGLIAYYINNDIYIYIAISTFIILSFLLVNRINNKLKNLEFAKNEEIKENRKESNCIINSLNKDIELLNKQLEKINNQNDTCYNEDLSLLLKETDNLKQIIFNISQNSRALYRLNIKSSIDECRRKIVIISMKVNNVARKKSNDEEKISKQGQKIQFLESSMQKLKTQLDTSNRTINNLNNTIQELKSFFDSKKPFNKVSSLVADSIGLIFEEGVSYLRNKPRPAFVAANEVKKYYKQIARDYIIKYKEMQYRYEYLLSLFPELVEYVENEEDLYLIENDTNLEDFVDELKEEKDHAHDYLSDEEWQSLSTNERNQLALDNYIKRDKSKLIIGLEYEMYIDFLLRKDGFKTTAFGIERGLNDLGRDIIATKSINNEDYIYIIQCKNWSSSKLVHENVICQTYGTAVEYELNEQHHGLFPPKVIPVLCTTTNMSETAQKFAKKLGVEIWTVPKDEYPRIKCNVNSSTGEKIYHLPFDQQYWNTKIENDNEFYAWTVEEAVNAGFRRAFRFTGLHDN